MAMAVARVAQQPAVRSQFPSLQGQEGEAGTVSPGSRKHCPHPGSRHGHPQHGPDTPAKAASLRHQQKLAQGLATEAAALMATAEHLKGLPKA